MIPYTSSLFFYVMSLALVPAIIMGLLGKNIKSLDNRGNRLPTW